MPKVTVIVPNYNHASYLDERLESILNQSFTDFELILLDDNSTDNSVSILSKYAGNPKVSHFIINETNSGSTFKQWEKGITLSKGEYIWIAESDDYADPNFLQRLMEEVSSFKNVGIAYSQSYAVNEIGEITGNWTNWTDDLDSNRWENKFFNFGKDELINYLIYKNTIPNASAVLFMKEALLNIPFNNLNMKLNGDWFIYMVILSRYNILYIPEPLNYFRSHNEKVTKNTKGLIVFKERLQILSNFRKRSIGGVNKQKLNEQIYKEWVQFVFDRRDNKYFNFVYSAKAIIVYYPQLILPFFKIFLMKKNVLRRT
jgi:glycosyltransferase involved in cell wall biosynthesis